ncbi:MAG: hypothetical protein EOO06_02895 [Chitinophagaceae bacterium]|nr:MAG: hypothetical protein EOO06_02895 [Chitinophagaceae bacterium]
MKLKETLLQEHSKAQCEKIVAWVGNNQKRFDELFQLFLSDEYRVQQRSSWPVSYCVEAHPFLIEKNLNQLINKLKQAGNHDAVKRNGVRLLQHIEIPAALHGDVMNLCFDYLLTPGTAVAIKAFSLAVLQKMSATYPEILPELKIIIEDQWDSQSAAFRSRANKLLKTRLS